MTNSAFLTELTNALGRILVLMLMCISTTIAQDYDTNAPGYEELYPVIYDDPTDNNYLLVDFNIQLSEEDGSDALSWMDLKWNGKIFFAIENNSDHDRGNHTRDRYHDAYLDPLDSYTTSSILVQDDNRTDLFYYHTLTNHGFDAYVSYDNYQDGDAKRFRVRILKAAFTFITIQGSSYQVRMEANWYDYNGNSSWDHAGTHWSAPITAQNEETAGFDYDGADDEIDTYIANYPEYGYAEIRITGEAIEGESFMDYVHCMDIKAKIVSDPEQPTLLLARVGHENLSCDLLSGDWSSQTISGTDGNNYILQTSTTTQEVLGLPYLTYRESGDGDFYVRYYYDNERFNKTIEYFVEGYYYLRHEVGNHSQYVYLDDNRATYRASDHFSIPDIAAPGIQVSEAQCGLEISWDEPVEEFGNPDNHRILIYRNGIQIASLDAHDPSHMNTYLDVDMARRTSYSYQIRLGYLRDHNGPLHGKLSSAVSAEYPLLQAPSGLSTQQESCSGGITLDWSMAENPASFKIQRKDDNSSFVTVGTADGTARTYLDNQNIEEGKVYYYQIAAIDNLCSFDGNFTPVHTHTGDTIDITQVIAKDGLQTSKGYFHDRTELFWQTTGINEAFASRFKIFGRELGTSVSPVLLQTVDRDTRSWYHDRGEAGVIYEYFVVAERVVENECGIQTTLSYPVEALAGELNVEDILPSEGVAYNVGLRSPSGIVNGNVTYAGGIPVPNVKIVAEQEGVNQGKSLYFDGADHVHVPNSEDLMLDTAMTLSVWVKPENLTASAILFKSESYGIEYNGTNAFVYIADALDQTTHSVIVPTEDFVVGNWINLTATYSSSSGVLNLYVNGENTGNPTTVPEGRRTINSSNNDLLLGRHQNEGLNFQGNLDEIRIYNRALTQDEVLREYGRITATDAEGLVAYWKVFEETGMYIYDAAHIGSSYFQHDGKLHGVSWSDDIPTRNQLGIAGYTDEAGNYTIEGVTYGGNGQNFKITPTITLGGVIHEFDPGSKVIFLGQGNIVENGVDFEDISTFEVSGQVVYDYGSQNAGVEDVDLYLDGLPISDGFGSVIKTDENGEFVISVPIGKHVISVQKGFHQFENDGIWPANGEPHDFQQDIAGLTFLDQTLRTVAGRVVGGTRESDKKIGLGKSINNIGQAQFKFVSENALIEATVTTDEATGEYSIELPPYDYLVYRPSDDQPGIDILTNSSIDFPDLPIVKLSDAHSINEDQDSVFVDGVFDRLDSYAYHLKQIFTYRNAPEVQVTEGTNGLEGQTYLGERSTTFTDNNNTSFNIQLIDETGYLANLPVYQMAKRYGLKISVFETYVNYDGGGDGVEDIVPVSDAKIQVMNNIGPGFYFDGFGNFTNYPSGTVDEINLNSQSGDTTYFFTADEPNLTVNASSPELSYTRTIGINVIAGGNIVTWPNPLDATEVQYAYVLGSRGTNTNFVTKAPDLVEFILRDPPGSNSYATISQGQSLTRSHSLSLNTERSNSLDVGVGLGINTLLGGGICGVGEILEIKSEATVGFNVSAQIGTEGEYVNTYEFTQEFQTNANNLDVGAAGDLYIGKSENFLYGISDNLLLIPVEECDKDEVYCVAGLPVITDDEGNSYNMGRRYGFYMVPDGEPTFFVYSQNHIENFLIPDLITLRNTILSSNPAYTSVTSPENALYGSNNDDVRWEEAATTDSPETTEPEDLTGPSYTFEPASNDEVDSVRWYNQQIRIWQETMARNEQEKIAAINSGEGKENYSISGGAVYSNEKSFTQEGSFSLSFELSAGVSVGTSFTLDGYGVSTSLNAEASMTQTISTSNTISNASEMTYQYEINDPDQGDFISVDVYPGQNGNGPVFSTLGGQTMCPHEDAIHSKYFEPGTLISNGTLQRDKPRLEVAVAEVFNVPADEPAVFTLTLYNESESFEDQIYVLDIVDSTNPNGAILKVDGVAFSGSNDYVVPGSGAINKTLTLERGPFEYDYDDIQVVIHSACQFNPTDNEVNIADTISISAHFIPVCTNVNISTPGNQWIANTTDDNNVPVVMEDYNINYAGFEFVRLEYKPSKSSTWLPVETFYRESENPEALLIPRDRPAIDYQWNIGQLPDGNYDLRAYTSCQIASTGGTVTKTSTVNSGLIDRVVPHVFGNPQPGDGIYSSGDVFSIQFNEPINEGLIQPQDFEIKGVLNGSETNHNASVFFGGSEDQYMEIEEGINLSRKSFSIDFYVKRATTGPEVLLAQGGASDRSIVLGFDDVNRAFMSINGDTVATAEPITDNSWHHLAFVYDHGDQSASLFINALLSNTDNDFAQDYQSSGRIFMGKSTYGDALPFHGNIHQLRLWNIPLSVSEINATATQNLPGNYTGLIGSWQMDEATGSLAKDQVRSKHAKVYGEWSIEPGGYAYQFDGSNVLTANSPTFSTFSDFSIEFWVNGPTVADSITFIANGRGDSMDPNESSWAIGTDSQSQLIVKNNNTALNTGQVILDGFWHHVTVSVSRRAKVVCYIDGEEVASIPAGSLSAFGGTSLWLGARGFYNPAEQIDQYFTGLLDEVRIWNIAKRAEHINADLQSKLDGGETGLVLYYPFESFQDIGGGIYSTTQDDQNNATSDLAVENDLQGIQSESYVENTPAIKLPRPVENVDFNYSSNRDKIIFSPTIDPARIEGSILTLSVKRVNDLNGNELISPISWTAFVDQSTLIWVESDKSFDVPLGEGITFKARIYNRGGNVETFQLTNIPDWLTASPTSGAVEPLESHEITFSVSNNTNIGYYTNDIVMKNSFGYDERLILNLNIYKNPPQEWTVDPAQFEYSMTVLNRLRIFDEFSRDKNDLIAAFVNGQCRGVTHISYVPTADHYQAYLSIYSNELTGETIDYRIWNASEGLVHSFVSSSNTETGTFTSNAFYGTPSEPIIFDAGENLEQSIDIVSGWQWLSFNLESDETSSVASFMSEYQAVDGDQIKSQDFFDQFDSTNGWLGTISSNGGIQSDEMYKLKLNNAGTLRYRGVPVDPGTNPIAITPGWNWIGYLGQNLIPINEALANVTNLQFGDLIKGQKEFATYAGSEIGWVGSLEVMSPGQGYLYNAANAGSIIYPAYASSSSRTRQLRADDNFLPDFEVHPENYADNMNMIIQTDQRFDHLIVFSNDQVRGVAHPVYNQLTGTFNFFLTAYGDMGDQFEFHGLIGKEQILLQTKDAIQFSPGTIIGSISNPYELNSTLLGSLVAREPVFYPNPVRNVLTVQSNALNLSTLRVTSLTGQQINIRHASKGQFVEFDFGMVPQGIYLLHYEVNGAQSTAKIVKQ